MAQDDRDEIHGEKQATPRFRDENDTGGYRDDSAPTGKKSGTGSDEEGGSSRATSSSTPSRREIGAQEGAGATQSASAGAEQEADAGGFFKDEDGGKRGGRLRSALGLTRKKGLAFGITGTVVGAGLLGGTFFLGPLQFIHMAQLLQKFHMSRNEDYGNRTALKILFYAKGDGQRSRLGVANNRMADNWEKRLLENTGMRPVYQDGTRRFIGFEIVDEAKAHSLLGDIDQESRTGRKVEESFGKGAEIRQAGDGVKRNGGDVDRNSRIVDLRGQDFATRRAWIKSIGTATGTNRIVGTLGSRLLIKRAGVNMHPLNKLKRAVDEKLAAQLDRDRDREIHNGTQSGGVNADNSVDGDGDGEPDAPSAGDVDTAEGTKSYIDEFRNSGVLRTASSVAIGTAVLCAVKSFGNSAADYAYTNTALPMMRTGMRAVASGNQMMAGDDVDMYRASYESNQLYDPVTNTSWTQAESIRAQQGLEGGEKRPLYADLGNLDQKPLLFRIVDDIPILGTVCSVQTAISNFPGIKQIGDAVGFVTGQATDAALSIGGTNTDELMESALQAVAGKGVPSKLAGAPFGYVSDIGMFLSANDEAGAMAGIPMTPEQTSAIVALNEGYEAEDQANKSIATKLFDPYDSTSVASAVIDSGPSSPAQAAAMISNPIKIIGSSIAGVFSFGTPKAKALGNYDYGTPMVGHPLEEQKKADYDMEYEDPYINALKVEPELERLNKDYGMCFGTTVTLENDKVNLHTDKSVNYFKIRKDGYKDYPQCNAAKNTNDLFNHYRLYIAAAVSSVTLACNEGDEEACTQLGVSSGGGDDSDAADTTATASGSTDGKELAKQILDSANALFPYVDSKGDTAEDVLKKVQETGKGFTNSSDALAVQNKAVELNPKMLQAIGEYLKDHKLAINALSNADHSATSNHYKGNAVDFDCSVPLDRSAWERIAGKYGGKNNGEVCPGNGHWHYDFLTR